MTPFQRGLWFARGVFVLAGALLVAAHFWPLSQYGAATFYCADMWQRMGATVKAIGSMRFEWGGLQRPLVSVALVLFIAAGPFVAGFLARARPLLWIARLLMVGFSGWLIYMQVKHPSVVPRPLGHHLLMGAFFIQTVGVLVIPKPPVVGEGERVVKR